VLLVWQKEVAGSTELQGSLQSSFAQLQENLKERDGDCSKMTLEMQVSCRHNHIVTKLAILL